jgi:hypothetical protein
MVAPPDGDVVASVAVLPAARIDFFDGEFVELQEMGLPDVNDRALALYQMFDVVELMDAVPGLKPRLLGRLAE